MSIDTVHALMISLDDQRKRRVYSVRTTDLLVAMDVKEWPMSRLSKYVSKYLAVLLHNSWLQNDTRIYLTNILEQNCLDPDYHILNFVIYIDKIGPGRAQ